MWALEIPLAGSFGSAGLVRVGHAFDRRAPLFRMQSLVELISATFGPALMAQLNEPRSVVPVVAPVPLAASLKAAAGARR